VEDLKCESDRQERDPVLPERPDSHGHRGWEEHHRQEHHPGRCAGQPSTVSPCAIYGKHDDWPRQERHPGERVGIHAQGPRLAWQPMGPVNPSDSVAGRAICGGIARERTAIFAISLIDGSAQPVFRTRGPAQPSTHPRSINFASLASVTPSQPENSREASCIATG
jgi:hypothetical protein